MKHNIRINGEVKEIDCELGSGILDKNWREIFEGNKVRVGNKKCKVICAWGNGLSLCDYKNECQDVEDYMRLIGNKAFSDKLEIVD